MLRLSLARRFLAPLFAGALVGIVAQHLSMARVAQGLGVSWYTANDAVLAESRRLLISDPTRFDGVRVIGVDEHVWRHTHHGDKHVTLIINLPPVRDSTGPARLLDVIEGRSKKAFTTWLAERSQEWRDRVEMIAMDGITGCKTAASERASRRGERDGPVPHSTPSRARA